MSARELKGRRADVVTAVSAVTPLQFVNGGGTGSVERTAAADDVTEVAAGSGLYCPVLFDGYRGFAARPAALFAVPVTRIPGPTYPAGLSWLGTEGTGEVQTPLCGPGRRCCGSATASGSATRRRANCANT